jgi:hypothetical protein
MPFAALFGASSWLTTPPPPNPNEVVGNPDTQTRRPDQTHRFGWSVPEKSGAAPPSEPMENSWIRGLIGPARPDFIASARPEFSLTAIVLPLASAAEVGVFISVVWIVALIKATLELGNLIKLTTEFGDKFKRSPNSSEVASIVHQSKEQAAQTVAKSDFASFAPLTQTILVDLTEKMTSTFNKIREVLGEPDMSIDEMNRKIGLLQREYCNHMFLMKKFNRGELPEAIKREWVDSSCSKYSFE